MNEFRVYDKVRNLYWGNSFMLCMNGRLWDTSLQDYADPDRYIIEMSTDLKGIHEGDKINVPIRRTDGRRESNIHHTKHSTLFLEMEVMKFKNGVFPLKKNEENYKQLCEPMGRERVRQNVNYPSTISDLIDWYDFEKVEIIGTIHEVK